MNPSASAVIREVMSRDEELLWAGRPPQGLAPREPWTDVCYIGFIAAAVVTHVGAIGVLSRPIQDARDVSVLGLLVFIGAFLLGYGLLGLFLHGTLDALRRKHIYYGLTSKRVLILTRGRSGPLFSRSLDALKIVQCVKLSTGWHAVWFGESRHAEGRSGRHVEWANFELGDDAEEVCTLILRSQREAEARREAGRLAEWESYSRSPRAAASALRRLVSASGGPETWPTPPEEVRPSQHAAERVLRRVRASRPGSAPGDERDAPDAAVAALHRLVRASGGESNPPTDP